MHSQSVCFLQKVQLFTTFYAQQTTAQYDSNTRNSQNWKWILSRQVFWGSVSTFWVPFTKLSHFTWNQWNPLKEDISSCKTVSHFFLNDFCCENMNPWTEKSDLKMHFGCFIILFTNQIERGENETRFFEEFYAEYDETKIKEFACLVL